MEHGVGFGAGSKRGGFYEDVCGARPRTAATGQPEILTVFHSFNIRHSRCTLGARFVQVRRPSAGDIMVVRVLAELAERSLFFQPEYEDRH